MYMVTFDLMSGAQAQITTDIKQNAFWTSSKDKHFFIQDKPFRQSWSTMVSCIEIHNIHWNI